MNNSPILFQFNRNWPILGLQEINRFTIENGPLGFETIRQISEVLRVTIFFHYRPQSAIDRIFGVIRELAGSSKTVKLADVRAACATKGFQPGQVDTCLEEYEQLNVWLVNQARTTITFV